jgi:hypothetical protein
MVFCPVPSFGGGVGKAIWHHIGTMNHPPNVPQPVQKNREWKRITDLISVTDIKKPAEVVDPQNFGVEGTSIVPETPAKDTVIQSTAEVEIMNNGVIGREHEKLAAFPLGDRWLIFGSGPSAFIEVGLCAVIRHSSISRIHCAMIFSEGNLFVTDLGSTNGTYIITPTDYQPVKGVTRIEPGAMIAVGEVILQVILREKIVRVS